MDLGGSGLRHLGELGRTAGHDGPDHRLCGRPHRPRVERAGAPRPGAGGARATQCWTRWTRRSRNPRPTSPVRPGPTCGPRDPWTSGCVRRVRAGTVHALLGRDRAGRTATCTSRVRPPRPTARGTSTAGSRAGYRAAIEVMRDGWACACPRPRRAAVLAGLDGAGAAEVVASSRGGRAGRQPWWPSSWPRSIPQRALVRSLGADASHHPGGWIDGWRRGTAAALPSTKRRRVSMPGSAERPCPVHRLRVCSNPVERPTNGLVTRQNGAKRIRTADLLDSAVKVAPLP